MFCNYIYFSISNHYNLVEIKKKCFYQLNEIRINEFLYVKNFIKKKYIPKNIEIEMKKYIFYYNQLEILFSYFKIL